MSNTLPHELEVLQKDVGTWKVEMTIRPAPGAEPHSARGTAVSRFVSHGRWLVTDFTTETGDFEGHGLMGYDPKAGAYVYAWVDTMRPFLAVGRGSWDASARKMTITTEAEQEQGPLRWREVTEAVDPDTQVFHSFMPGPDGSEFEMITAVYRRQR
ncbi:MAG: DUF1579 domain-containing protein [Deltaproteobacteria bacterium]|nr:DUF1579 domain-containing protein [Deltaproteobacteria bacterium]